MPDDGQSNVMSLIEVISGSVCQPMKQSVEVQQEFPNQEKWSYIPTCVSLWRCSGCCTNETFECHPLRERNVTLELIKVTPFVSQHTVRLTFVEHQQCECRMRETRQHNKRSISDSLRNGPQTRPRKPKKAGKSCGRC